MTLTHKKGPKAYHLTKVIKDALGQEAAALLGI